MAAPSSRAPRRTAPALGLLACLLLLRAPPSAPAPPPTRGPEPGLPEMFSADCGHRSMRIVGGRPAAQRKWPWQVSLQVQEHHVCGGSLITSRWVLTAAHCIYGHLEYKVMMGDTNVKQPANTSVLVPVQDIVVHSFYTSIGTIQHDIALALLAFPVEPTAHVQPVCLPSRAFAVEANKECWVTGWGRVQEDDPQSAASQLQEADQNIILQEKCNKIMKKMMKASKDLVKKGTICAYNSRGKDSCQGDSGGPLVCEFNETWVQVGIVSWGIGCGRKDFPGVYTEVSFYKDWIDRQVSQGAGQDPAGVLLLGPLLGVLATP